MRLAIMQPYLFPYIGYFQLIHSVDKFVIYDDVNYIKQGWINRNSILCVGRRYLFSVPINDVTSSRPIRETSIDKKAYPIWMRKFLKTIHQSYLRAPCFDVIYDLVETCVRIDVDTIGTLAASSINAVMNYLQLKTQVIPSSITYCNMHLRGQDRVIDICHKEGAHEYVNSIGGVALYDRHTFAEHNLLLSFIKSRLIEYRQFNATFISSLSIIDVLMHCGREETNTLLQQYDLV